MLEEFTVYFNTNVDPAAAAARAIAEAPPPAARGRASAAVADEEGEAEEGGGTITSMRPGQHGMHASPQHWLPPSPSEL